MNNNTVTLPCKVGDMLFRKDGMWECIGFDCDETGNWRVKLRQDNAKNLYNKNCNNYLYTRMVFGSFGKTVFTSREEYEKMFPPKPLDSKIKETQEKLAEQQRKHQQWLLDKHLSKCCFD